MPPTLHHHLSPNKTVQLPPNTNVELVPGPSPSEPNYVPDLMVLGPQRATNEDDLLSFHLPRVVLLEELEIDILDHPVPRRLLVKCTDAVRPFARGRCHEDRHSDC